MTLRRNVMWINEIHDYAECGHLTCDRCGRTVPLDGRWVEFGAIQEAGMFDGWMRVADRLDYCGDCWEQIHDEAATAVRP